MTGLIVIDKPRDITSFAAVSRLRRIVGEKKAGHTGTLDPMATGVLPIMLGGATRFSELLPSHDKGYRAKIRLGTTTDTLDVTGEELTRQDVTTNVADFERVLKSYVGDINQIPPMYSAISKDGVRLYELARKGIEIERETRPVTIYSATLLSFDEETHEYEIDVKCSAGTYIRSHAADIGNSLGCGGILTALRRTLANGFTLENSVTFEQLEKLVQQDNTDDYLLSVDSVLHAYSPVTLTAAQSVRFKNGGNLFLNRLKIVAELGYYRVYSDENMFLGVGEIKEGSEEMSVKRVFTSI
jgi:tRNA pseudouridine55 synthase